MKKMNPVAIIAALILLVAIPSLAQDSGPDLTIKPSWWDTQNPAGQHRGTVARGNASPVDHPYLIKGHYVIPTATEVEQGGIVTVSAHGAFRDRQGQDLTYRVSATRRSGLVLEDIQHLPNKGVSFKVSASTPAGDYVYQFEAVDTDGNASAFLQLPLKVTAPAPASRPTAPSGGSLALITTSVVVEGDLSLRLTGLQNVDAKTDIQFSVGDKEITMNRSPSDADLFTGALPSGLSAGDYQVVVRVSNPGNTSVHELTQNLTVRNLVLAPAHGTLVLNPEKVNVGQEFTISLKEVHPSYANTTYEFKVRDVVVQAASTKSTYTGTIDEYSPPWAIEVSINNPGNSQNLVLEGYIEVLARPILEITNFELSAPVIKQGQMVTFTADVAGLTSSTNLELGPDLWVRNSSVASVTTSKVTGTFTSTFPGSHELMLTATEEGQTVEYAFQLEVENVAPVISSASFEKTTVTTGESISLVVSATDPGNDLLEYELSFPNASPAIAPISSVMLTDKIELKEGISKPGVHKVQLVLLDPYEGGRSEPVLLDLVVTNRVPTITSLSFTAPDGKVAPQRALIRVEASDPDGTITKVKYSIDGMPSVERDTLDPYEIPNLPARTYNLTVTVEDNNGGKTTQTAQLVIDPAPEMPTQDLGLEDDDVVDLTADDTTGRRRSGNK